MPELIISDRAFNEIRALLKRQQYPFMSDNTIDTAGGGIVLRRDRTPMDPTNPKEFTSLHYIGNDDPIDGDPLDDPQVINAVHRDQTVGQLEQELADGTISSEEIAEAHARKQLDRAVEAAVRPLADAKRAALEKRANERQVGGSHYGGGEIQHWDLVTMFRWNYFQAQAIRYIMRYLKKNGLQDLEKAQHYLEKLIEEIKAGRMPEKEP